MAISISVAVVASLGAQAGAAEDSPEHHHFIAGEVGERAKDGPELDGACDLSLISEHWKMLPEQLKGAIRAGTIESPLAAGIAAGVLHWLALKAALGDGPKTAKDIIGGASHCPLRCPR
jgi:hypothetical protein